MIGAFFFRYRRVLAQSRTDAAAMLIRPLLSGILLVFFAMYLGSDGHSAGSAAGSTAGTVSTASTLTTFMIVSSMIANVISNSIIGAAYEARQDLSEERLALIRLAPGGIRLYSLLQATSQFAVACCQSLVVGAVLWPLAGGRLAVTPAAAACGCVLFTFVIAAATLGARFAVTRGTYVAISFAIGIVLSFSGVFYPVQALPGWAQVISEFSPLTPVISGLREGLDGMGTAGISGAGLSGLTALIYPLVVAGGLFVAAMAPRWKHL